MFRRTKDESDSRLAAIYGPILHDGDVQQHIIRQTLWRTKSQWETRFMVLRESALLLYKDREALISIPKDPYANGASANIYKGTLQRRTKLRREVNVWCRLDHPNIMPLLGITYDFGTSLSMLVDIARGLAYLHSMSVTHGDLHSANILISERGHTQLTDFGLSMITPDFEGTSYLTTARQVLCAETPFASAASRATSEYCLPSNMANAPNNRG
ncbi:kinase-like domain-containing protein [Mycena olivaceomarginata]|nr:kinase-like domain-containing protein [Mycena olivaceomarginata]